MQIIHSGSWLNEGQTEGIKYYNHIIIGVIYLYIYYLKDFQSIDSGIWHKHFVEIVWSLVYCIVSVKNKISFQKITHKTETFFNPGGRAAQTRWKICSLERRAACAGGVLCWGHRCLWKTCPCSVWDQEIHESSKTY